MPAPLAPPGGALPPALEDGHAIVPVANGSCPGFAVDSGGGIDWNPLDHVPVVGDASKLASRVGDIVGRLLDWVHHPGDLPHDVLGWVLWNTIGYNPDSPGCYAPSSLYGFARSVLAGDVSLDGSRFYHDAYLSLAVFGTVLIFAAVLMRVLRHGLDATGTDPGLLIVETLIRAVAGVSAIVLGFAALQWLLPLSAELARSLFITLSSLTVTGLGGSDPLGILLFTALQQLLSIGVVAIVLGPVLLYQLARVVLLMITRFAVVTFGIVALPVMIALAVFDHRHHLVRWYAGVLLGALVAPIVVAFCLGATIGLSLHAAAMLAAPTAGAAPILGVLLVVLGSWLTGHVLRRCLFGLSGHHSPTGFLRALTSAALEIPVAVGSVLALGALASAGGAGAGLLAAASAGGRGGLVQSAMRTSNPLSRALGLQFPETPSAAYAAFRSSPAGASFIADVTGDGTPGLSAEQRWAGVEADPGMDGALRRLRHALHAESARTGRLTVPPDAWASFESSYRDATSRPTTPVEAGTPT